MRLDRVLMIVGAAATAACGGAGGTSPSDASTTIQAYQAVGQGMTNAVTTYRAQTAAMPDDAACQAARDRYQAAMEAMLARMQELSVRMDGHMSYSDHAGAADMGCVTEAMTAEYERHMAVACTGHDVTTDRTEAATHTGTMGGWLEHQRIRYEDAGSTTCGMMSPTETTWTCHQNADGSFTMGDHTFTCGPGSPPPPTGTPTDPAPENWPTPCRDDCRDMHCGGWMNG